MESTQFHLQLIVRCASFCACYNASSLQLCVLDDSPFFYRAAIVQDVIEQCLGIER